METKDKTKEAPLANKLKHYEMLYIMPVKYTADELPRIKEKINNLLAEYNCQITYEEDLGKGKLAYPIKQIHHGYYLVTEFNMDPVGLKKLNNSLRLAPEVLRHLIITKTEKTRAEIKAEKERRVQQEVEEVEELKEKIESQAPASMVEREEEVKEVSRGKVTIEDLDKKLDELIDDSIL